MSKYCWDLLLSSILKSSLVPVRFRLSFCIFECDVKAAQSHWSPPPPMDVHGCVKETVSCIYTSLGGRAVLLKPSTGQSQGTLFPEFIATCVEIVFSMFFFCVAFLLRTHTISHLWLENRDTTTATDDGTKLYLRIFVCCVHMEMFRLIWLLFWPAKGIKPLMSPPCL